MAAKGRRELLFVVAATWFAVLFSGAWAPIASAAPLPKPEFPVVFIHGLGGSPGDWDIIKSYVVANGWTFGGSPRFDRNSNIVVGTGVGDFYTMGFSIANQNLDLFQQGWEIAKVIEAVVAQNPDRPLVILVGHSMGGLGAREYIQGLAQLGLNQAPVSYRNDVAQLVTIGTPHRGAEVLLVDDGTLDPVLISLGFSPGAPAIVELTPGSAELARLNDLSAHPFPDNVRYASIVGVGTTLPVVAPPTDGDGVVSSQSQNLGLVPGASGLLHDAVSINLAAVEPQHADCVYHVVSPALYLPHSCELDFVTVRNALVSELVGPAVGTAAMAVIRRGRGSGRVTGSGIDCGTACTNIYDAGAMLTLTAVPDDGMMLLRWDGPCTGKAPTCTVTLGAGTTVAATFVPAARLTVVRSGSADGTIVSTPAGIACGAVCSALFEKDSIVQLDVTAVAGIGPYAALDSWSGAPCAETATIGLGRCSIRLSGNTVVMATFVNQVRYRIFVLEPSGRNLGSCNDLSSVGYTIDPPFTLVFDVVPYCQRFVATETPVTFGYTASSGFTTTGWLVRQEGTGKARELPGALVTVTPTLSEIKHGSLLVGPFVNASGGHWSVPITIPNTSDTYSFSDPGSYWLGYCWLNGCDGGSVVLNPAPFTHGTLGGEGFGLIQSCALSQYSGVYGWTEATWFQYTATRAGTAIVVGGDPTLVSGFLATAVSVYRAPDKGELGCSQGDGGRPTRVAVDLEPGVTYLIRLGFVGASAPGLPDSSRRLSFSFVPRTPSGVHPLDIALVGPGAIAGRVRSTSGAIDCKVGTTYAASLSLPGDTGAPLSFCSDSFAAGQVVTLNATTTSSKAVFTRWSGACNTTGPCTVTLDAAKFVVANFDDIAPGTGGPPWFVPPTPVAPISTFAGGIVTFMWTPAWFQSNLGLDSRVVGYQLWVADSGARRRFLGFFNDEELGCGVETVSGGPAPLAVRITKNCSVDVPLDTLVPGDATWWVAPVAPAGGTSQLQTLRSYTLTSSFTATLAPTLTVSPSSLAFGDVDVGGQADLTVRVENTGQGVLSGAPTVSGTGFRNTGPLSYSLGPGQFTILRVTFSPGSGGSATGTLTLTGAGGATIPLSGRGKTPPARITVNKLGTGTGTVTSATGVSCGGVCSQVLGGDSIVTLTAAADAGSTFGGWTGGGCSGTGPCTVVLTSSVTVAATFTAAAGQVGLSVVIRGSAAGTVAGNLGVMSCPSSCARLYPIGTPVTLTASAPPGSSFKGWSGAGCSGTGLCVVTLAAVQSVAAIFSAAYTDPDPVAAASIVRAMDITQLRSAVNKLRAQNFGLPAFDFTDPDLAVGATIRAIHFTELRTALGEAHVQAGVAIPGYTDSAITLHVTAVRAAHLNELRNAVRGLE